MFMNFIPNWRHLYASNSVRLKNSDPFTLYLKQLLSFFPIIREYIGLALTFNCKRMLTLWNKLTKERWESGAKKKKKICWKYIMNVKCDMCSRDSRVAIRGFREARGRLRCEPEYPQILEQLLNQNWWRWIIPFEVKKEMAIWGREPKMFLNQQS